MKTLILYYSKTGFTQRYAQWLAEDLGAQCVPYEKRKAVRLSDYDAIAFGGRLTAGVIGGAKWFFKEAPGLSGRRLALFFTGAMPPDPEAVGKAIEQNVPQDMRQRVPAFYLQGGLCYEKMGLIDKAMMAGLRKMLASKKAPSPEEQEAARMVAQSYDKCARENLHDLEAYLRG